ncbi:hypothetical protein KY290_033665 [Solanum tuberosum]|uniref:Non-LTR retroelement reverse transcriptase n=1 Tax=Solanum tuberosum TaxID=4113 RepID=A0ABQ7U0Z3_SOLTU|nr:hypothetical protein KY289_033035 [Solanum tuberosum]KAH0647680.1 hypothetical protein KY285_032928 [Solanum tuberosum]KAH0740622.1 hypothetical protein KY290_033665 [Solanum tuberosum]
MLSEQFIHYSPVLPGETQDFQDCIDTLELTALKTIGCHYTFCNKQQGNSRVYSKIDWVFGNLCWMTTHGHVEDDYLGAGISDHSPIRIQMCPPPYSNPKPFKLFKIVLNRPDFGRLVDESWQKQTRGTAMVRLWQKLKYVKLGLKNLNSYMASYGQKLIQVRHELELTQISLVINPLYPRLIEMEKQLLEEIRKWSDVETLVLQQKSRANWIKGGDANTKFFHAQVKIRESKNSITSVYDNAGIKVQDPQMVEAEFIRFYSKIMGARAKNLPCPNVAFIKEGPCLTYEQKCRLVVPVTKEEIMLAIKSMPTNKSPGIDGSPIEFFVKNWTVVKLNVVQSIQEFFHPGKCLKPLVVQQLL